MSKPTEAELLELALEPDLELEYEMTLRMTDDQIRDNLRARGHDLRVLEAEADILWNMFRPRKTRAGVIAGGVAIATAAATTVVTALLPATTAVAPLMAVAASAPSATPADALRADALNACDRHAWKTCLAKLDQAKAIDPAGEKVDWVAELRERAELELGKLKP